MKKMGDTVDKNQTKAGGGVLKSTTWGAIALAFLAAVWGFTSNAPRLEERSTTSQAPAKLSTQVTPLRGNGKPAQDKPLFASAEGQPSRFSGFSFDRHDEKAATSAVSKTVARTQVAPEGPANAIPTPQSDAKDQTETSLSLEAAQDAQLPPAAKIAPDLKDTDPEKPVDVIVQFRQAPTDEKWENLQQQGGQKGIDLSIVKGGTYTVSGDGLSVLAADSDVVYISPNRRLRASSSATLDYHTAVVNAPAAWSLGLNGSGVGVAVIDSGIIDIPDLHNMTCPQAPRTGSYDTQIS